MTPALQRQRYILDFTVGSMLRRKGRNGILLGLFLLMVFLLASVLFYTEAIRREAKATLIDAPELIIQSNLMGRHDVIGSRHIEKLAGIRGVRSANGRLWGYYFDGYHEGSTNYTLMVPTGPYADYEIAQGDIIVGEGVARARKLHEGKVLYLSPPAGNLMKFRVAGMMNSESALVTSDLVLMHEADFRSFFQLPEGVYTDIALEIRNIREIDTIVDKAIAFIPHARFITRDDILRTYDNIFSWRQSLLLTFLGSSLLAFLILTFDKASGLSAEEKREIGILKAVGWHTGDILLMKFWEGFLIASLAFLFGCSFAYLHVFQFSAPVLEPVVKGWARIYPDFQLTPSIDFFHLSMIAMLTIIPFSAATILPVWRAAVADPDEVMR